MTLRDTSNDGQIHEVTWEFTEKELDHLSQRTTEKMLDDAYMKLRAAADEHKKKPKWPSPERVFMKSNHNAIL